MVWRLMKQKIRLHGVVRTGTSLSFTVKYNDGCDANVYKCIARHVLSYIKFNSFDVEYDKGDICLACVEVRGWSPRVWKLEAAVSLSAQIRSYLSLKTHIH
jgi:hypothetical protein